MKEEEKIPNILNYFNIEPEILLQSCQDFVDLDPSFLIQGEDREGFQWEEVTIASGVTNGRGLIEDKDGRFWGQIFQRDGQGFKVLHRLEDFD